MTGFHLLRPWWLLAFLPLAALCWRLVRQERSSGDWSRVCDAVLLPHILIDRVGGKTARRTLLLFAAGGVLAILALAGPVWERLPAPAFRNESALVIALDLSHTMDAADLKPSRLERARFKIADILKQRKDGLTALLVYSGDAFTVTPLTDDAETIAAQLSALTSDVIPAQGSRADLALQSAERLLNQAGLTHGDVLLISSGANLTKGVPVAQQLKAHGYRLSVLGAGSEQGAPIPLPEGGFLQDTKGSIVISKLATPALRQLAEQGGGLYQTLTTDNTDLSVLLSFFEQQARHQGRQAESDLRIEQWQERGPWLLLALLPLAALAFRRGYLAMLLWVLILPIPKPTHAFEWQDLWQTRDQQARQAFESGQPERAAEVFQDPAWKAGAQYRANQFEETAKTLQGLESADAHYNRGNALAKLGRYPEAIAAYDKALTLDPKHEDARYNKELVEKAMKEQQEKQQPEKNSGEDQQQDREDQKADKDEQTQKTSQGQQGEQPENRPREKGEKPQHRQEKGQANQEAKEEPGSADNERRESAGQAERPEVEKEPPASEQPNKHPNEDQQASEQWLRRIPDDPGGLLRRKFYYQYQQRKGQEERR